MPSIIWNDAFSVGSQPLDDQHKKWFELYNEVRLCSMKADESEHVKRVSGALKKMIDYAGEHFRSEEAYMKEIGFPGLADHALVHRRFVETVDRLCRDFSQGKQVSCEQILEFVKEWLLGHVAGEDRSYASFSKQI